MSNLLKFDYDQRDDYDFEDDSVKNGIEKKANVWAVHGDKVFEASPNTVRKIGAGYYKGKPLGQGRYGIEQIPLLGDDLTKLPQSTSQHITDGIAKFLTKEAQYKQHGLLWKRGIMLYGPPGSGKTTIVRMIGDQLIEQGGIVYYITRPAADFAMLNDIRMIEPKRPLLVIFEDMDEILRYNDESEILSILDGEIQLENVIYIATTNYVGRLGPRFVNRPSRFDEVHLVDMPTSDQRQVYLVAKQPTLQGADLQLMVDLTAGFSIAHIKELLICVNLLEIPLMDAAIRLHEMNYVEDKEETRLKKAKLPDEVVKLLKKHKLSNNPMLTSSASADKRINDIITDSEKKSSARFSKTTIAVQ